ncbi:MAG: AsmA-like C-terminal region-containing protein, partial [Thiogranum sp.]
QLTGSGDDLMLHEAQGSVNHKGIELSLNGEIGDLKKLNDIQFALKGSGTDLAELSTLVGKTLPETGPFEVSGKLTGSAKALALSEAQGTIGHTSIELSLAGGIADLIALEGIDLHLKGSGNDLAELSSIVASKLPQTGPFEVSGRLTGTAKALALGEVQGTIGQQSIKLSLTGGIGDLIALDGFDLHLKGSGNDLAELSAIAAETLPKTGPFKISGRLTGTSKALALTRVQGTIGQQGVKIALAGRIDDLMTLKGIRLDVKGSGKSLGELRSLLGDKLPDTGPFSATARLTGSAQVLAVAKLRASVRQGNAQLAVSGKVADVMKLSGIDLGVEGSGKNLGELRPLFDTQLPDLGPFRINGQLSGSDNSLELKNFTAAVDQSDFAGWAKLEFGKRPRVTVRLESGLVDFTRIMEQAKGENKAEAGKAGGSRRALFSDEPLPFDLLDAVDADIAFNARNLKARDAALEFGQLALRLDAGDLRVDTLEATYEGAKVSASLNVTTGSPADVAVRFLVQGFDLGRFLKETHVWHDVEGRVDLAADLKSRGNSLHHLMVNLDGTTGAVIGKGYVPRFLDLLAQDLSRRVITIWGHHKKAGQLNCGVIQFTNKQGIATSDAFLFNTQLAILKGDGEINLATEQLDFVLSPKPKDSSLFSLATKLRVDGSILDPRVRPNMTSVATKGVKALSSLVLGPAGLLVPFMKAGARHQHPCDVAELKNRIQSIYR